MLIGQVSRETGVSARSIRYYESRNLLISQRLNNGYRDYDASVLERIGTIKACLNMGFDLEETERILECTAASYAGSSLCSAAQQLFQKSLQEVDQQISIMTLIRERLQTILSAESTARRPHHDN